LTLRTKKELCQAVFHYQEGQEMICITHLDSRRLWLLVVRSAICLVVLTTEYGYAQQKLSEDEAPGDPAQVERGESLEQRFQQLQDKVARLEAALKQKHTGRSQSADQAAGMRTGGMQKSGMMKSKMGGASSGGMKSMKGTESRPSGSMKMGSGAGMGMDTMKKAGMEMGMKMKMGMGMMGRMKGMENLQMASALPGFPGASHIYHIGATSFFLDHAEHITLTSEQQTQLNRIKEEAMLAQGTLDRQIEESEQQLWVLTGADSPDVTGIEARVGEIAKLTANKRIAFIRSVGQAAGVLTVEQRSALTGSLPSEHVDQNESR
jgi:uncharacterized small protein (DUF1192 family)